MGRLILFFGSEKIKDYPLKDNLLIGRDKNCDIVIDNLGISRHHAQIKREGKAYMIFDLGSINGTYVNGKKIKRVFLNDSDVIFLGKYSLKFEDDYTAAVEKDMNTKTDTDSILATTMNIDTESIQKLYKKSAIEEKYIIKVLPSEKEYPFISSSITIGKSKTCDIIIKGWRVSFLHAVLVKEIEGIKLINTSIWGIQVMDKKIKETITLKMGDRFYIGKYLFIVDSQ